MTKISVEEIRNIYKRIDEINSIPLEDIQWTENGKELKISTLVYDEFRFIGLTNTHFILTDHYKLRAKVDRINDVVRS